MKRQEAGFTLIELMIAVALLGVGMAFMTNTFLKGWELWKRNYTDLLLQRQGRMAMEQIVQGLRQAEPSTIVIDSLAGEPKFSRISFTHVKTWPYVYYKRRAKLY